MYLPIVLGLLGTVIAVWRCPDQDRVNLETGRKLPCGWTIVAPGFLTYPADGADTIKEHCKWTITAPEGKRLMATIKAIDFNRVDKSCSGDYLEISTKYGVVGKYCELLDQMLNVLVPSSELRLAFYSDEKPKGQAFSVQFDVVTTPGKVATCGGELMPGDSIEIPVYNGGSYCTWIITAPNGMVVDARFSGFDPANCNTDYLKVYPLSGRTLKYCGSYKGAYGYGPMGRMLSSEETMKVEFHAGQNYNALAANFSAVHKGDLIVQYLSNFWIVRYSVTLRMPNYVLATVGNQTISMVDEAVAQIIHPQETKLVNISIKAGTYSGRQSMFKVRFESYPTQSWVIRTDGVYLQDGSSDLAKTTSSKPDHPWDIYG